MKHKPYAQVLVLALCSFFVAAKSMATTTEELNLSDMTNAAAAIVTAEVVSSTVDRSDNQTKTLVTLRVTDAIKGNTGEFITLALPGGSYKQGRFRVGRISPGAPQLFSNQSALLFLNNSSDGNTYTIVGYNQGFMPIRDTSNGLVLQNTAGSGSEVSVSTMKQKIIEMEAQ